MKKNKFDNMDFSEIKNKSKKELQALLTEQKNELRQLRFKIQSQQLKQVNKIKIVKKIIARINTVLTKAI
ncbi:MAG: 50S ribosomal protein L29 [Candidatus Magasanikbacteria bacterium CG10_big_fil_rev_8_21_14_0_10_36_32]|uniref:Large ribosomal subunit protein uL29 n=1 Tax=Candidatus Magasanikbacteria bacterium CG10_big_fil_rev_8_21_14_0_10_36_32 TaxID=1974646 RepID=A0A2M6W6T3_9BACT|nr:MAG: 50S ribosomal protein L29 [Candidatus Magasanikbacteria bacterium CG10_big_fil_rev_8_21_14_0_10_36_32]